MKAATQLTRWGRGASGIGMLTLALMVALWLPGVAPALADEKAARTIRVTGTASVEARPDMATVTISVTRENARAARAMRAVGEASGAILARLEGFGIAPKDVQTSALNLRPVWSDRGTARRITGHVAESRISVAVRDLDRLGEILDALLDDGANGFGGLIFGLADPGPLQREAQRRAVADALVTARLVAEAAGVTLGPVVTIEAGAPPAVPVPRMRAEMALAADIPIAEGEVSVSASVGMVFAIAD